MDEIRDIVVPRYVFLTNGVGTHREKLQSFEMALRDAKIAQYNLVRVSSIYPPLCKVIPRHKGVKMLEAGQIVYCVLSDNSTDEPHRLIAASVGLSTPAKSKNVGPKSRFRTISSLTEPGLISLG